MKRGEVKGRGKGRWGCLHVIYRTVGWCRECGRMMMEESSIAYRLGLARMWGNNGKWKMAEGKRGKKGGAKGSNRAGGMRWWDVRCTTWNLDVGDAISTMHCVVFCPVCIGWYLWSFLLWIRGRDANNSDEGQKMMMMLIPSNHGN